ncbi:MAG TPA: RluA family pseudouridine synthase [Thermoanaerobaculia bacterium]|nr:RluA family pseudouridine synthase [Thermoanaerobaculia bacterium]
MAAHSAPATLVARSPVARSAPPPGPAAADPASEIDVSASEAGQRLDRFLADRLDLTRNRIQRWVREGLVLIDGQPPRSSHIVSLGERIEVRAPSETPETALLPEPGELVLLHQDADILVLDKEPGLVVHPGAGRSTGTLSHRLLQRFPDVGSVGHPRRPGIVHRLDRDTSGAMVVARSERAYRVLSADFASHRVGKLYFAIAWGRIEAQVVDQPIGRHTRDRKRMAVRPGGRAAQTEVRPLVSTANGRITAVAVRLHTGRTHQIRVHLQYVSHPLLGDPVYGEARWKALPSGLRAVARDFPRCALHAWVLVLRHPGSGTTMRFEAPIPGDLARLWSDLGGDPVALRPPPWDGLER